MGDICGDNRFEIIAKAKQELLESTNIHTSEGEMKVLDSFLFRCWQMGWLERYDKPREPLDIPTMSTNFIKEYGLYCPDGYIFKDENGNIINATKIVLEKKEKKYPKTYEECCKVLGYDDRETYCIFHTGADERLFEALYNLKVCRDAYWKIAGEEMGLDDPWEPDWTDDNAKYSIYTIKGVLTKAISCYDGAIFVFPTEEMRDAFCENFKELIEQCKELL